jgi:hypothetical protein
MIGPSYQRCHMPKQIAKPKPKHKLEVRAGASIVISGLPQADRGAVDLVLQSADAVLKLPVAAKVAAPRGTLYAARVTPQFRLIYRRRGNVVEVTDVMNAELLKHLPPIPAPRPASGAGKRNGSGSGKRG